MLYICIMKNLSSRIYKFLDKYAAISPNWDEEYKYGKKYKWNYNLW